MWKMYDNIFTDCTECGTFAEPPPKFNLPPPPLPPLLAEYGASNCKNSEEKVVAKNHAAWDIDMCDAIPMFDTGSFYSNQSLQTTAMIAVLSLLIVLVALISSLFLWKNKRKVQLLVQCKTRNAHGNSGLPMTSAHHPYEDPEAYFGQLRPLVFQHQHNVELLQYQKQQHYPSGYPMTHSPPFLISNSPGPDPYCSHDNVYEELTIVHDTDDDETEAPSQSEDDFAGDELSYTEEAAFMPGTSKPPATVEAALTNIYADAYTLSEPAASQCTTNTAAASGVAAHANFVASHSATRDGILAGMLRHVSRKKFETTGARRKTGCRTSRVADIMPQALPMSAAHANVNAIRTLPLHLHNNQSNNRTHAFSMHNQFGTNSYKLTKATYNHPQYQQQQHQHKQHSTTTAYYNNQRAQHRTRLECEYDYAHAPLTALNVQGSRAQTSAQAISPVYDASLPSSSNQTAAATIYQPRAQDLSFGSDSGYSQYTPTSSIGHNEDDISVRLERKTSKSRRTSRTPYAKHPPTADTAQNAQKPFSAVAQLSEATHTTQQPATT